MHDPRDGEPNTDPSIDELPWTRNPDQGSWLVLMVCSQRAPCSLFARSFSGLRFAGWRFEVRMVLRGDALWRTLAQETAVAMVVMCESDCCSIAASPGAELVANSLPDPATRVVVVELDEPTRATLEEQLSRAGDKSELGPIVQGFRRVVLRAMDDHLRARVEAPTAGGAGPLYRFDGEG